MGTMAMRRRKKVVAESLVRRRMQVALSLLVVLVALYLVLFRAADTEAQKWAFGIIGIVLGFWLNH